jgi:hypothetical protein
VFLSIPFFGNNDGELLAEWVCYVDFDLERIKQKREEYLNKVNELKKMK